MNTVFHASWQSVTNGLPWSGCIAHVSGFYKLYFTSGFQLYKLLFA